MPRPVVAAAIVDSLEHPTVLLACSRAYPQELRGQFELPGGKIEEGEDAVAALEREIAEELGAHLRVAACGGRFWVDASWACGSRRLRPVRRPLPRVPRTWRRAGCRSPSRGTCPGSSRTFLLSRPWLRAAAGDTSRVGGEWVAEVSARELCRAR